MTKFAHPLKLLLAALACATFACSGDAPEQSDACAQYVSCLQVRDARLGITTNAVRFEGGGDCWGSEAGAHLCDTACSRGLEFLAQQETATECQP